MTKKTRNWLIVFGILALPFLIYLGFFIFDMSAPPPLPPLPNPNGYDDFVKAGTMIRNDVWDYDKMNEQQLQQVVSADAAALSLARAGLSKQCRVPIEFSETYISNHLTELAGFKRMAEAFTAEGKLAEMENRPADAAQSYLDAARLGGEITRGGVLIDELVGIADEAIGTSSLQTIAGQLDAKSCREAAASLELFDSNRETLAETLQMEDEWSLRTYPGWRNELARGTESNSLSAARSAVSRKFDAQQQKTRQLMIDLAARAYELEKGKPPASASDLVPDYLKAVPKNPVTGGDLNLN